MTRKHEAAPSIADPQREAAHTPSEPHAHPARADRLPDRQHPRPDLGGELLSGVTASGGAEVGATRARLPGRHSSRSGRRLVEAREADRRVCSDELGARTGGVCHSSFVAVWLAALLSLATACSETVVHMRDGSTLKGRVEHAEGRRVALTAGGETKRFDVRDVARVQHAGETEALAGGIVAGIGGATFLVGLAVYANVSGDPDAGYDGYRVDEIIGGVGAMLAGAIIAAVGGGVFLGGSVIGSDSRDAFRKARSVALAPMIDPSGERHGVVVRWRW